MYTGLDDAYSEASSTSSAGRSERPQQSPGMGISNRSPPDLLPSYARRLTCWKASWDIWILATFFPGLVKEVPVRRAPAHPHVMECCSSREKNGEVRTFGLCCPANPSAEPAQSCQECSSKGSSSCLDCLALVHSVALKKER